MRNYSLDAFSECVYADCSCIQCDAGNKGNTPSDPCRIRSSSDSSCSSANGNTCRNSDTRKNLVSCRDNWGILTGKSSGSRNQNCAEFCADQSSDSGDNDGYFAKLSSLKKDKMRWLVKVVTEISGQTTFNVDS